MLRNGRFVACPQKYTLDSPYSGAGPRSINSSKPCKTFGFSRGPHDDAGGRDPLLAVMFEARVLSDPVVLNPSVPPSLSFLPAEPSSTSINLHTQRQS